MTYYNTKKLVKIEAISHNVLSMQILSTYFLPTLRKV